MSHLRAIENESFRAETRSGRRLGVIAAIALLGLAVAACALQMAVVEAGGGEDAGSVLFVFG